MTNLLMTLFYLQVFDIIGYFYRLIIDNKVLVVRLNVSDKNESMPCHLADKS
jgi:hypothetical protein